MELLPQVTARRTLLFLSADLIGSTLYKHKSPGSGPLHQGDQQRRITTWLSLLKDFFVDFSNEVIVEIRQKSGLTTSIWKLLGDEIIFAIDVDRSERVCQCLEAFSTVVRNWDKTCAHHDSSLGVKGCAWIAEFPYPNITLPLDLINPSNNLGPLAGKHASREDYVGPQMDCAFRMSKLATREFIIVSVEVAYCLLSHGGESLQLYFKQVEDFKGVPLQGGYPVFEIASVLNVYTKSLLLSRSEMSKKDLCEICCSFFQASELFKCPDLPDLPKLDISMGYKYDHASFILILEQMFRQGAPGPEAPASISPIQLQSDIILSPNRRLKQPSS